MNTSKIEQIVKDQEILPKTNTIIELGVKSVSTKIKEVFNIASINKYSDVESNLEQLKYCVDAAMSDDESKEEADNFQNLYTAICDYEIDSDENTFESMHYHDNIGKFEKYCLYKYFGLKYSTEVDQRKLKLIIKLQKVLPLPAEILELAFENVKTKIEVVYNIARINKYEDIYYNDKHLKKCIASAMAGDESEKEADNFQNLYTAICDYEADSDPASPVYHNNISDFVESCLNKYFGLK